MAVLTVLGGCGAWPTAGRASNGFLLAYEDWRIVLDLGYGTFPRLQSHCDPADVDAVIISHEHPDHCVDLSAFYRARRYGGKAGGRIPLLCPPGVVDRIDPLEPDGNLSAFFDIRELPGAYEIGPFQLTGLDLPHFVPNAGIRLTGPDFVVAYTGDTGPSPKLVELGYEADLFIVDATYQGTPPEQNPRYLLSAFEAGEYAEAAKAERLLLTHFWPGSDRRAAVEEARTRYSGRVLAAEENLTVDFGPDKAAGRQNEGSGTENY